MFFKKLKIALIFLGDIAILYGSLALTLIIRYGQDYFDFSWQSHFEPFSVIFIFWLLIFYLADFYSDKFLKNNLETARIFSIAIAINILLSIAAFYAFEPFFQLTPKTNLLIFSIIFGVSGYFWRIILAKLFIAKGVQKQVLIIGNSPTASLIIEYLKNNPQTGYNVKLQIKELLSEEKFSELTNAITNHKIEMIVAENHIKKDSSAAKIIYRLLPLEVQIIDLADFYELLFQKVPLDELEETWFIEQITTSRKLYETAKRFIDVILGIVLNITFLPLMIIIAVLIKITSKGPVIYKQKRIGKNDEPFILYKFRTMIDNHSGPLWTTEKDGRLTAIGKILRYAHLDELPQLINILKGDISFIGPRPERSELAKMYSQLPYYEIRHIIKPGLTGWAQLNYKPSASLEEAQEKLQYDIYYIKNRSLFLDFLIVLKTIKYIFISHQ